MLFRSGGRLVGGFDFAPAATGILGAVLGHDHHVVAMQAVGRPVAQGDEARIQQDAKNGAHECRSIRPKREMHRAAAELKPKRGALDSALYKAML